MKKYLLSLNELHVLAKDITDGFKSGVIILRGDLASGKTTLVKEILRYQGTDAEVTSPTFSLQHRYGEDMYHYDMYNKGLDHFISLGMLEELEKEGLHFVEWGDDELRDILISAGIDVMTIDIDKISDDKREYKVCIR